MVDDAEDRGGETRRRALRTAASDRGAFGFGVLRNFGFEGFRDWGLGLFGYLGLRV